MSAPDRHSTTPAPEGAGFFVAFEGPEGAGKSTQIALLAERLELAGIVPVCTREPGGTPAGDRIRDVILDPDLEVDPLTEFLLYSASRAQLVRERVAPALEAGRTVITDRFAGASLAYQGYGRGLDRDFIHGLTQTVTRGITPDLTILLDIDVTDGLGRVARRGARDRLERADRTFHERVRAGFLEIASADPTWHRVEADGASDRVADRIWTLVTRAHPRLRGSADAGADDHAPEGDR